MVLWVEWQQPECAGDVTFPHFTVLSRSLDHYDRVVEAGIFDSAHARVDGVVY